MSLSFTPMAHRRFGPLWASVRFALLAVAAGALSPALAEVDDDSIRPPVVNENAAERITVTATKQARQVSEVTGAVDVIGADQLDNELARDIKDMVRYLPGVSVRQNAGRFGLSDFTIRGLSGNRVLIEVDGVRIPDSFSIGSFSNANRNFVDLDSVKAVEIIRGSASSLYGSNAIGGVVTFLTKDPEDYLNGQHRYARLKAGYSDVDQSHTETLTGAFSAGRFSALAVLTHEQGSELESRGRDRSQTGGRTAANPQDREGQSVLAKLVWQLRGEDSLRLTADRFDSETDTESYWARTTTVMPLPNPPGGSITTRVLDLAGDDRQQRERLQLDYEFHALLPGIDAGLLQLYRQQSETRQQTTEWRESGMTGTPLTPSQRWREFQFDQAVTGLELTLTSAFALGGSEHTLTYGVELAKTDTEQLRNGYSRNLITGTVTNIVMPDIFPVRDFPLSETTETAIYLQDEIAIIDGRLLLVPALRYDRYQLDSRNDAIFAEDNPGTPVDLEHSHSSPKLGLLYKLSDQHSLFAQYAEGFRAPPVNDVNIGFTNVAFGYTAIPNPALKPEQSRNLDIGWRWRAEWGFAELTAFRNHYDDFIESLALVSAPGVTPMVFQSVNLHEVTIEGYELRAGFDLQRLLNWPGFTLRAAYAHADGRNKTSDGGDVPLDSVDPDKLVLGLIWETVDRDVAVELVSSHVRGKAAGDVSSANQFRTDGYTLWDLLARWQFGERLVLQAGLFNLGDERHWEWADVRGQAANSETLERYTRPGRNAALNVSISF